MTSFLGIDTSNMPVAAIAATGVVIFMIVTQLILERLAKRNRR